MVRRMGRGRNVHAMFEPELVEVGMSITMFEPEMVEAGHVDHHV